MNIKAILLSSSTALLLSSPLLYAEHNESELEAKYQTQKKAYQDKLNKASKILEETYNKYPNESIEVSTAYKQLAKAYENIDSINAISYYLKALRIDKKILKENDLEIAKDYLLIADIYYFSKQYQTAALYLEKTIEIREKVLGKGHIDTAEAYQHISGVYNSLGETKKALLYSQKLLDIQEKVLGQNNEQTKVTGMNIEFLKTKLKEK